jgi:hypothetical protein
VNSRSQGWWLVLLVFAAAALLRLRGLERELPHLPEPDSYMVMQAQILREGREPDLKQSEKGYYAYPLLLARGLALLPEAKAEASAPVREHLAAASADSVRSRTLVAVLSLLFIPATWLLARRFTTPLGALIAAALAATSLLHLEFSQQARHHAPHASFALLTVLAALQLRERPDWVRYLVVSGLALLALGMLHSGWFALLPILAAHVLREKRDGRASFLAILIPIAACALAWTTLYPHEPVNMNPEASWAAGGHTFHWRDLDLSGFAVATRLLWDYDPGLAVAAFLGLVVTLWSARAKWRGLETGARKQLLVALAYTMPYGLALGVYKETCDRMLLPLVPFLATLGGIGVVALALKMPQALRAGVLGLALAVPTLGAVRYATVRDADDTFEQAAQWIEEHTSGRAMLCSRFALPLASDVKALELVRTDHATRQKRWVRYQLDRLDANGAALVGARDFVPMPGRLFVGQDPAKAQARLEKFLADEKPEWVLIDVSSYTRINPLMMQLRDWATAHGTLSATFHGEPSDRSIEPALDYQDVAHLFWRLLSADAFGPPLELYHITR